MGKKTFINGRRTGKAESDRDDRAAQFTLLKVAQDEPTAGDKVTHTVEFKIGDKVKVTGCKYANFNGQIGTIACCYAYSSILRELAQSP